MTTSWHGPFGLKASIADILRQGEQHVFAKGSDTENLLIATPQNTCTVYSLIIAENALVAYSYL